MAPKTEEDNVMTVPANTLQQPGDLDARFASEGMIDIPRGSSRCVAETFNEELLYVARSGNNSCQVYRARSDGSADPAFTSFQWQFGQGKFESPHNLMVRDDGKFLLIGSTGEPFARQMAISRFNPGGSPDLVFGTKVFAFEVDPVPPNHVYETDYPTGCVTADKHVLLGQSHALHDSSGSIIESAGRVYRLDNQGNPDQGFNGTGMIEVRFDGQRTGIGNIAILPDQRFVVFGSVDRPSGGVSNQRTALACYHPDGTLDPTFANSGFWEGDHHSVYAEMVLDKDKVIVASISVNNGMASLVVTRLLSNGSVDLSFNHGAALLVELDTVFMGFPSLAVQSDGKIVIGGSYDFPDQRLYWLRITATGELDASFGGSGVVRQELGGLWDLIVQRASGRIIVAADLGPYNVVRAPKIIGIQG
jgi:uncharacterized delta-60 repeat protein